MQKDMHYYGTYALARAAGIKPEDAQIIASAAQFVDDNEKKVEIDFTDKGSLYSRPTGHNIFDIDNRDTDDQRVVWVPFHFLPGGAGYTFEEKIVCQMDSGIAREMCANYQAKKDKKFYRELIGIAAHVYADTFSHYGFSGLSSDQNDIDNGSIELDPSLGDDFKDKIKGGDSDFLRKFVSHAAEKASKKLGHGSVLEYPDIPCLKWSFKYEHREGIINRDNPATFLQACEALYNFFREVCENYPEIYEGSHRNFAEIKNTLQSDIIPYQDLVEGRIEKWKDSFRDPTSNFTPTGEEFLEYLGDKWNEQRESLDDTAHSSEVVDRPVYQFYKAASYHRHYILRDLLPEKKIVVS
ncbi:MAG TPA: hypothetical protein DCS48_10440 [Desulfovibrio sp.]|nr:hypothetical protein [Desulfovibrio sp.]